MYFEGIGQFKGKGVEKLLNKKGYNNYELYFSPFSAWLYYLLLLSIAGFPLTSYLFIYWDFLLAYFLFGFIISADLNHSFAITKNELIVINPNFPYKHITRYAWEDIKKIKIDRSKWYLLLWIIFSGGNYIEIYGKNFKKRFFCVNLQIDCYDENITEKTMDDFVSALSGRNILIEFNLD